jgi:GNAT superfamily N-acetyltransferase
MTGLLSGTDLALARRIEAAHAHSATTVQGVVVEEMAGGWAIFHRVDSPVTQAIGIGMKGSVAAAELDRLERFFHQRGSAAVIDLCTLADASLVAMLQERGFVMREISHIMARRVGAQEADDQAAGIGVERATELRTWSRLVMQGFAGQEDVPEEQVEMLASSGSELEAFFGRAGGVRCAAAAMAIHAGLATLFGDATLVQARGQGLQLALIRERLRRAAELGCDLATASVAPGGTSHRNYERAGFQLLYGRVMVRN